MAKEKNGKFWLWILVSGGTIIASICIAWATLSSDVKHQGTAHMEAINQVKTEGCLPARQSKTDIQLMQKDVEIIQRDVDDIKKGVDELLKR